MERVFGKYRLVERLGRGGMGEVWKAKLAGPGGFERLLVVKRILPYLLEDPRFIKMFFAEARLSALLHHPNVVQVFQLEEVEGEWVLTMEYVNGRDLSTVLGLRIGQPQPPGFGAFVVREVCRALAYAHTLKGEDGRSLRLIHRDISPSNVMLSYEGAVKVLDFGLAKALDEASSAKTRTGALRGKLPYLSPEQVGGMKADHRADQFAAGLVLYEALTGRRVFSGAPAEVLAAISAAVIEPPSRHNPDVPPELDAIVLRALERDREARYESCEAMGRELEEVVLQLRWTGERLSTYLKELAPPSLSGADLRARITAAEGDDDAELPEMMPPPGHLPSTSKVWVIDTPSRPWNEASQKSVAEVPVEVVAAEPPPVAAEPASVVVSTPAVPKHRGWMVAVAALVLAAAGWWLYSATRVPTLPPPVAVQPAVPPPPPAPVTAPPARDAVPPPPPPAVAARPAAKPIRAPKGKKPPPAAPVEKALDLDKGDIVDVFKK
jgi:serine/threonine protein kinase